MQMPSMTQAVILSEYPELRKPCRENPTYKLNFKINIGHFVIEDQLKSEDNRGPSEAWSSQYSKGLGDSVYDLAGT